MRFKKDTEARKRAAQLQEAEQKIVMVEEEVEKVTEITAPLDDEASEAMPKEEAASICEKAGAQAKTAQDAVDWRCMPAGRQEAVDQCRALMTARQQENKGNPTSAETVKGLQAVVTAKEMS